MGKRDGPVMLGQRRRTDVWCTWYCTFETGVSEHITTCEMPHRGEGAGACLLGHCDCRDCRDWISTKDQFVCGVFASQCILVERDVAGVGVGVVASGREREGVVVVVVMLVSDRLGGVDDARAHEDD